MSDLPTFEQFRALLGSHVALGISDPPVQAEVAEVSPIGGYSLRADGGYTVLLLAPRSANEVQGVFGVALPGCAGNQLFVAPRGPRGERMLWEIIFN